MFTTKKRPAPGVPVDHQRSPLVKNVSKQDQVNTRAKEDKIFGKVSPRKFSIKRECTVEKFSNVTDKVVSEYNNLKVPLRPTRKKTVPDGLQDAARKRLSVSAPAIPDEVDLGCQGHLVLWKGKSPVGSSGALKNVSHISKSSASTSKSGSANHNCTSTSQSANYNGANNVDLSVQMDCVTPVVWGARSPTPLAPKRCRALSPGPTNQNSGWNKHGVSIVKQKMRSEVYGMASPPATPTKDGSKCNPKMEAQWDVKNKHKKLKVKVSTVTSNNPSPRGT
jgi:hypothetical protein